MRFQDEIYPHHLQKSLNDLRLSGISCDVAIHVGENEFAAHKSVLSAASPFFRAMFSTEGKFKESKQDKITLREVDPDAVASILKFIYTSDIEIDDKNVYPLMETSSFLQIHSLRAWINHYLQSNVTVENCLSLYVISNLHDYNDIAENTLHFILLNFSQVAEGDEFPMLPFNVLVKILSSKLLNVSDDSSLLMYILIWINSDVENRKKHLDELLNYIEISNIPVQTLMEVKNDTLLDVSLRNKVEICIKEHLKRKDERKRTDEPVRVQKWENMRYGSEQAIILAIGGESSGTASKTVECFTLGYESWKYVIPQYIQSTSGPQNMGVIPAMKFARYNTAAASDSCYVYVLGGRNSSDYLDECEMYDIRKNRWRCMKNIPCKLEGSSAVIFEGKLVMVGGRNEQGCISDAWEWDEKHKSWRTFPSLNSPRSFHGLLVVAGYIFALGGYDSEKEVALRTGERYDLNLNKWTKIRPMHEGRAKFGCAVVDNFIYVIGGIDENFGLRSVEKYNFETNEWTYMAPMSVPRHSFSVAVWEKKIYCIGGSDTIHYLNNVEKFNPQTNRWHYFLSLQMSRLGLAATTIFVPFIKRNFSCYPAIQLPNI